jgi:DNA-binding MarR family transcriptional regulator
MEKNGWVKLHRKMLDNPIIMKDAEHLAVWMYLLLNATHAEYPALFKGEKITLQPGQLITGRKSIASTLDVNESKVRRILDSFENDQQIDRQRSNQNTLISLINWEKYQLCDQPDDQQMTNDRPTTDHKQEE